MNGGGVSTKTQFAGIGGAASIVFVWLLTFLHILVPADVAGAIATLFAWGFSYLAREQSLPPSMPKVKT